MAGLKNIKENLQKQDSQFNFSLVGAENLQPLVRGMFKRKEKNYAIIPSLPGNDESPETKIHPWGIIHDA